MDDDFSGLMKLLDLDVLGEKAGTGSYASSGNKLKFSIARDD